MSPTIIPFLAAPAYSHTQAWVEALQKNLPDVQIVAFDRMSDEAKATCTVAIVANPDPVQLKQLPKLQWVHSVWAGVERLISDLADTELKIVRLIDPQLAATMAEAVLAWTLYLHRDMPAYTRQQKQQLWQPREYLRPQQRTIGLLGLGALGEAAAKTLLQAGFNVIGWSRDRKTIADVESYAGKDELPAMLSKTDILICLLPLTPTTRGLINEQTLQALPRGASLINFARGAIVNDGDLYAALENGHVDHAVLDVFETEPLPAISWHWLHPSVTVLPHCSAPTDREAASLIVANNIQRYRRTGELPVTVNRTKGY